MLLLIIIPAYAGASFLTFAVVRRLLRRRWDYESLTGLVLGPPLLVVAYFYITQGQPTWVKIGTPLVAMIGGTAGYANAKWRDRRAYWIVVGVLIALVLGIGGYLLFTILNG
jgi:hypothetical protein